MIRASKIEIYKFSPERRSAWKDLSKQMQRMLNRMWQIWLVSHFNDGDVQKIERWYEDIKAWHDTKSSGPKPKLEVKSIGNDLSKEIYHALSREFTGVNARTRTLLQNKWNKTLAKRKATRGSLSGWLAILVGNESVPSFHHAQPIPFDKENAKLCQDGDKRLLTLRIERLPDTGKSVVEHCDLMLGGRKRQSQLKIVDRIIAGEYAWKGSSLYYDERKNKWFAVLSYEMPEAVHPGLDPSKEIHLLPGKRMPWIVFQHKNGKRDQWRFGGRGRHVEYFRCSLQNNRWSRQEHYRWSGTTQRKGAKRAKAAWTKLSSRWKHFVRNYNEKVTTDLVRLAVQRGIGTVIYHQPKDEKRDCCYLYRQGRHCRSSLTWDWFQVGTLLANKCEAAGVEFVNGVK